MHGKTIELFLANGTADGMQTAELANWNGKVLKLLRSEVRDCDREDFRGVGVYFLLCRDEDGSDGVYVGEAENVKERLVQHLRDAQAGREAYDWQTAVCVFGRDLNKALIRYLEHRFATIAAECRRYKILTRKTYRDTVLKESQKASMEEFIDNARLLVHAMGYRLFVPQPHATSETHYFFCRGANACARGFPTDAGFMVMRNSVTSDHEVESFELRGRTYYNLRRQLESDGTIRNRKFVRDYEFTSPSAAAAVVQGRTANGLRDWTDSAGKMLGELMY